MVKWVESRVDNMRDVPYMVGYTSSTVKRDELMKLCKKAFGHAPMTTFQLVLQSAPTPAPMPSPLFLRASPAVWRTTPPSCRNLYKIPCGRDFGLSRFCVVRCCTGPKTLL